MRRVKIESAEDLEALPEGEWVHVPGGIKADWFGPDGTPMDEAFVITLSADVARDLRRKQGTRFSATLRGKKLLLRK